MARRPIPPVSWGRYVLGVLIQVAMLVGVLGSIWLAFDRPVAVAGGVGVALFTNVWQRVLGWRERRAALEAAPMSMSLEERTAAWQASRGGPIPDDPAVRAEAGRLAAFLLAQAEDTRSVVIVFGIGGLGSGVAAISISPWLWLTAAIFAILLALVQRQRRQTTKVWQRLRVVDPAA